MLASLWSNSAEGLRITNHTQQICHMSKSCKKTVKTCEPKQRNLPEPRGQGAERKGKQQGIENRQRHLAEKEGLGREWAESGQEEEERSIETMWWQASSPRKKLNKAWEHKQRHLPEQEAIERKRVR